MKRYILRFPTGLLQQQNGINGTYYHLLSLGAVTWIIDTKKGEIMMADSEGIVQKTKIPEYHDSDLIIEKD